MRMCLSVSVIIFGVEIDLITMVYFVFLYPFPEKTFSKNSKKSFRFAGLHPVLSKSASQICRVDATEFQQEFLAFSEKPKTFPENGKAYFPYNEEENQSFLSPPLGQCNLLHFIIPHFITKTFNIVKNNDNYGDML